MAARAVEAARELAGVDREAFLPRLADALAALATVHSRLADIARRATPHVFAASDHNDETLAIYDELIAADPVTHLPTAIDNQLRIVEFEEEYGLPPQVIRHRGRAIELMDRLPSPDATDLYTLGKTALAQAEVLIANGDAAEALAFAERAVDAWHRVRRGHPHLEALALARHLAEAHRLRCRLLSRSGDTDGAVDAAGAAVTEAVLLGSDWLTVSELLNHADRMCDADRRPDAVVVYTEATQIANNIEDPRHLAAALTREVDNLIRLERYDDALDRSTREVELWTQVGNDRNLAYALTNHAVIHNRLNRFSESIGPAWRALELYEQDDGPDVAAMMNTRFVYAMAAWMLRRFDDALTALTAAVDDCEQLGVSYNAALAELLGLRASVLSSLGRHTESLVDSQRAVEVSTDLAESDPERHHAMFCNQLLNHTAVLERADRLDEALELAREVVDLYDSEQPQRRWDRLLHATAVGNLADCLSAAGAPTEAVKHAERSLSLMRNLTDADSTDLPDLVEATRRYSEALIRVGRRDDAMATSESAARLSEALLERDRHLHLPIAAKAFRHHAEMLHEHDRGDDALEYSTRSLALYRELHREHPHGPAAKDHAAHGQTVPELQRGTS